MLATNAGLLTPILGDPSPWNPERLYINGEAGAWYDPGDLTAEKVAWRRNLLTWSEQFDNAAWVKSNATITGNASIAPDGTTTADTFVESVDGAPAAHFVYQQPSFVAGQPYTYTLYAKAIASDRLLQIYAQSSGVFARASFNLNTGAVVSNDAGSAAITAVGSGWYRLTVSGTPTTTGGGFVFIVSKNSSNLDYTGNGSQVASIWGAMLNPGTVAESYQRITDFTSDFLAAFPTHALYQDSAGTTPVTVLGQPVGLALDKSRGALANIGATVLTNGDFASGTGWTAGTGWSIAAGVATKTAGTASVLSQAVTLTIPGTYRLVYTMTRSAGTLTPRITGGTTVSATARSASGTYTEYVTTVTGNTTFEFSADASFAGTVDDVALQLVPGVHAIQPTSASRPALDARVNLLTYSEQFDNAAWTKTNVSVTANAATAPDGSTTADRVVPSTGSVAQQLVQGFAVGAVAYTQSVYAKVGTYQFIQFNNSQSGTEFVNFDVATGSVGTVGGSAVAAIENVGNGWYRCTVTYSAFTAATVNFRWQVVGSATATRAQAFAGDGTNGVLMWGADLRLATDAAYPYQRVVTATDYADVGVPRSFLHDGFDDSSYTASSLDLSGTDKVTVWAGVYKNSDAAFGVLAELTANAGSNNGGLAVIAPGNSPTRYQWVSRGTAAASAVTSSASFSAPHSAVFSGVGDIAADVCALRINGAQVATDSTDQGTGNYANAVLYMGRRNNTSNPLNGKVYCIIIRGGVTDAATLALTERYVGSRMGIVL
jgi:hypothetical protein